MSELKHPALIANQKSILLAAEGNKDAWLALYAEDALLQDPVGISPLDPEGKGHHGKSAIEIFWDTIIAPANMTITIKQRIISGPFDCAVFQTVSNDLGNGKISQVDMLATYSVNEQNDKRRVSKTLHYR